MKQPMLADSLALPLPLLLAPCLEPPLMAPGSQGWLLLEAPDSAIAGHPQQPSVSQRGDNVI